MDSESTSGAESTSDFDMEKSENDLDLGHEVDIGQSNDNQTESKLNPLDIAKIVENILDHLDVTNVKVARQVNKFWKIEGAKILFKKCWIAIPWTLQYYRNDEKNEDTTQKFKTFLSYNSLRIPHLKIEDESADLAFLKFIKEQTKHVKSLKWRYMGGNPEKIMENLLYQQLPNLNYLDIGEGLASDVKKVIINFCTATKNEQVKKGEKPFTISLIGLVAEMDLNIIEDLEKFVQCEGVMINKFFVFDSGILATRPRIQNQFIQMINTVLQRNQKNLIALKFLSCQFYLSQLHFPITPNLTKIELKFDGQQNPASKYAYAFPSSFTFAKNTPKLKVVILWWEAKTEEHKKLDIWTKIFEKTGSAPSVKELHCTTESSGGNNIEKVLQIFPNVEDFEGNFGNIEAAAPSIWKFGLKIKSLSFFISLDTTETKISNFDSIFTGFTQQTVDRIKNSKDENISGLEGLRVNPSILDLKGLETLTIQLASFSSIDKYLPRRVLTVAGEYAFKLMPHVNIKIDIPFFATKKSRDAFEKVSQLSNVHITDLLEDDNPLKLCDKYVL